MFNSTYHGIDHWKRVERNGLYLAEQYGFSEKEKFMVSLFAYFHDSQRINEGIDIRHGPRAGKLVLSLVPLLEKEIRRDALPDHNLNLADWHLVATACREHTHCKFTTDIFVEVCCDADRLDIGRVGIEVDAKYLFTAEAKRIANQKDFSILEDFSF